MKPQVHVCLLIVLFLTACSPADPHVATGTVRLVIGDCQGAIADYDRAINLNPQDTLAYYSRGTAYACQADYDQAVLLVGKDPVLYFNRGSAYAAQGKRDKAAADLQHALTLGLDAERRAKAETLLQTLK